MNKKKFKCIRITKKLKIIDILKQNKIERKVNKIKNNNLKKVNHIN